MSCLYLCPGAFGRGCAPVPKTCFSRSVIPANAGIQCLYSLEHMKKQSPWMPDQAGHDKQCKYYSPAPSGVAAPQSRNLFGGEDCLSEASSAAQTTGTGAKAPGGPRPGANGFESFCRNKRTSSCGGEPPASFFSSCGGETPREKEKPLDPRVRKDDRKRKCLS